MAFGKHIEKLRKDAHITIKAMSDMLGVTSNKYRNWEKNDLNPDVKDNDNIVRFFGLTMEEISSLQVFPKHLLSTRKTGGKPKKNRIINSVENKGLTSSTEGISSKINEVLQVPDKYWEINADQKSDNSPSWDDNDAFFVTLESQEAYIYNKVPLFDKAKTCPLPIGLKKDMGQWVVWEEININAPTLDLLVASRVIVYDWDSIGDDDFFYIILADRHIYKGGITKTAGTERLINSQNNVISIQLSEIKDIWKVRRYITSYIPPYQGKKYF